MQILEYIVVPVMKNVPNGARVSIPNDPSNGGRALLLLQSAGLIKLRSGVGYEATPIDVVSNPMPDTANDEFLFS